MTGSVIYSRLVQSVPLESVPRWGVLLGVRRGLAVPCARPGWGARGEAKGLDLTWGAVWQLEKFGAMYRNGNWQR